MKAANSAPHYADSASTGGHRPPSANIRAAQPAPNYTWRCVRAQDGEWRLGSRELTMKDAERWIDAGPTNPSDGLADYFKNYLVSYSN
jgi:hypothetical protein